MGPNSHHATVEEVARALRDISSSDLLRLEKYARIRTLGTPWLDWEDVFQEAVSRTLSGQRKWPTHVPFVVYMKECMRSIAHEEVRRRIEGPITLESQIGSHSCSDEVDIVGEVPDQSATAEREIIARQALDTIFGLFADDRVALSVLQGLAHGLSPDQVCKAEGISRTDYESAQRKIRRRLAKLPDQSDTGKLQ